MGKTIFVLTDDDRNPISDSIVVTLTKTTTPFTIYTGTKIPSIGNNNGARVFTDVADGDYTVKYDGNTNSDLSPLHVAGPGTVINSTIGTGEVTWDKLADGSVVTIKIADLNVTTDKIANLAITAGKIAVGAISGSNIADGAITKAKLSSGIFATSMEDVSGWGVKVDGVTISKATGTVKVPDAGIGTTQIADAAITEALIEDGAVTTDKIASDSIDDTKLRDAAVTTDKINDAAITTAKIIDDAITIDKIFDGSISTDKISDGAVTEAKINNNAVTGSKIADGAVDIDNLELSLKNSMVRFPTDVAYVSPEFSDNVAPYFDNIPDAYASMDDVKGTIYIYPGTYTAPILMGESVNLIGMDKTRCILQIDPSASENYGIKITATNKSVLIKNLTIRVEPSTRLGVAVYGIQLDTPGSNMIRIEDILLLVQTQSSDPAVPDDAVGIDFNAANFRLENSFIQIYGGNYGTGWNGGDALGIYLHGTSIGVVSNCQVSIKNKGGASDRSTGFYYLAATDDVDITNCIIGIVDTGSATKYSFESAVANTILVMNTLYSTTKDSNTTITNVASVEDANVVIKDNF